MTPPATPPTLTIAVINHHLRGYPADCLESLGAGDPPEGTEFLLIDGCAAAESDAVSERFPHVRVLRMACGDRAAAKNLAVAEAHGEVILLATADTIAPPGAVGLLREFVASLGRPALVSAQLLNENGFRRRTSYLFPCLVREINPFSWVWRRYHLAWHMRGRPPATGPVASVAALHATFLMAQRDLFRELGEFTAGYRFAHEDIDFCRRASERGIDRLVLLNAHAYKTSPQLYGELALSVRVAMEKSLYRLVRATRGPVYSVAFLGVRRAKSLCKWILAAVLNRIIFRCSVLLANEEAVHGAILLMPWREPKLDPIAADVESHVRWERFV